MQTLPFYNFLSELLSEQKISSKKVSQGVIASEEFKTLQRSGIIKKERALNGGWNYVVNKQAEFEKYFKTKFPTPLIKPESAASKYRATALSVKEQKCERCGYNRYPEILVVHHLDRNRKNGAKENLELLCPNCHEEVHLLNNDGRFRNKKNETAL
jgi:5-methylcytosine-specific restriction endonuclease McrA